MDLEPEVFFENINLFLEDRFRYVTTLMNEYREKMETDYQKKYRDKPSMYEFRVGQLVMLRNFKKRRLATKAVGPYQIIRLGRRSATIRPMNIGGELEHQAPGYYDTTYNLQDLAPLMIEGMMGESEDEL